jgi:hypothetical protein
MLFAHTSTAVLCGRRTQKWHLHDQEIRPTLLMMKQHASRSNPRDTSPECVAGDAPAYVLQQLGT